ncbi:MAG: hypothetical protein IJN67_13320 [Oscillospiraceae bacterium]|nr:hypothetical protein [Oscillospiraceae bacterium]
MQVPRYSYSIFYRVIVLFLIIALLVSFFPCSVYASEVGDLTGSTVTNFEDVWTMGVGLLDFLGSACVAGMSDIIWGDFDFNSVDYEFKNTPWYCSAGEAADDVKIHQFTSDNGSMSLRAMRCVFCGLSFVDFKSDLEAYLSGDFISSLDSPTASSGIVVTGFSGSLIGAVETYGPYTSVNNLCQTFPSELTSLIRSLGILDRVAVFNICYSSPFYLVGMYWGADGRLMQGIFENPLGQAYASLYGVYSFDDLTLVDSCRVQLHRGGYAGISSGVFYDKSYAEAMPDFLTSTYYAVDWSSDFAYRDFGRYTSLYKLGVSVYEKKSSDLVWSSSTTYLGKYSGPDIVWKSYYIGVSDIVWDNSRIIIQPSGADASSRPLSLMELIDEFNRLNSYLTDEDSVNLFLGTKDENGNLLGVYSPSVYNEETMVFTEPVSGAQYLTTGWSYDYYDRSYDISVAPGTFSILETDITRIVCRYGDDEVYISYYDADGNLVSSDVFAYVMVSQSACSLDGHSYTVETIKESTCTSMGERLYTCSVCGDQKIEEVSMKDHRVTHSVFEQATCTDPGYAFYTCMDCGTQYGEPVPAMGHDWLPVESSESTYALPADAACPDCSSVDFSSVLDKEAAVYTCTCNGCGSEWLESAQVTYGYITYSCSRCGSRKTEHQDELDNGLFTSIGKFFADGIRWCTDKLTQFVDGLTGMLDTFNGYLEQVGEHSSSYPSFLSQAVSIFPEDMMAVIWFLIVASVVVAVIKFWFQ